MTKFYRPQRWTDAQILEEHQFSLDLAEAEIPMVAPLQLAGQTLHQQDGWRFAVFPSVGGRTFEVDNDDQLEWVGRYLGRLHCWSANSQFSARRTLDPLPQVAVAVAELEQCDLIPIGLRNAFFAALDVLLQRLNQRWFDVPMQRIHGDCHPSNILWRDGPLFVDLDDALNGPVIQDLWMFLSGSDADKRIQMSILLEGYEEFADFDTRQLALIEPLRAQRVVCYMAWLSQRWSDSAFQQAFPWFATEKYWEGQILVMKELAAALDEPPLTLFSMSV